MSNQVKKAPAAETVKHTELPWRIPVANLFRIVSPSAGTPWQVVADMNTDTMSGEEASANATFIVTAINSYTPLMERMAILEVLLKTTHRLLTRDVFSSSDKLADKCAEVARQIKKHMEGKL